MPIDDLHVINQSLSKIGSKPINALDEETSLARQATSAYFARRDMLLGRFPWEFAKQTLKLDQVAETTGNGFDPNEHWGNGWRHAFAMPGNRLSNPRKILTDPKRPDHPLRRFMIERGRVFADETPLWGTFTVGAAPELWTPAFMLAAITLVAADMAVPITQDQRLAEDLRELGEGPREMQGLGGLVAQAIAAEVSAHPGPPPLMMTDDLTTAHMT